MGRPIYESFDYICGVSTGAILALLIGASKKSISEVETMYREISTEVFRQDRSSGLATLLWNHAYYNSEKWEKILQDKVGKSHLPPRFFIFDNLSIKYISLFSRRNDDDKDISRAT